MQSDEDLMLAVAKGDLDSFSEIVHRHQRIAWSVAYRFLVDPSEAEDIAQESFLKILVAAPRYKPTAAFSTYLYRVVGRLCIDHIRKKGPVYTDALPEIPDCSPDPAMALTSRERDMEIHKALSLLPPNQRMAIILKHYEGLSYSDIAQVINVTVKAVERLLSRAGKTLRSHLSHLQES